MKKIFFVCMMSLIWALGLTVSEAEAQTVYYYTDVAYYPSERYVDGYTTTYLDYWAGLYYDPAVQGDLYRTDMPEPGLDSGYDEGFADIIDAEVYLFSTNYVEGKTYCTGSTHFVIEYDTRRRYVVGRLNPCIPIPFPPPPTPTPTPVPTPTPNVTSVTFAQIQTSTEPISPNQVVSPHNPGIGERIFPDDDSPQDPVDRRQIRVTATLSQPISNVPVYFRNFDLDDPTDDTTIDPNGNAGDDNNGTPMAGQLSIPNGCGVVQTTIYCPTDSNGAAAIEFTVTRQPGDNFAIAAGTNVNEVNAVNMTGIDLISGSGQTIPTTCGLNNPVCRSRMLTVWRRLHIEVDSMGEAQQNFVAGTIPNLVKLRPNQTARITVNSSPNQLEPNRFEGGRLVVNGTSLPVTCDIANNIACNTANTVRVQNTNPESVTIPSGSFFQLFDDDDFNDDDGTNVDGDTGEDITEPDTALLTANSDDPNTNVFAPAYVRPVYDVVDPNDNSYFQANAFGDFETDIRPMFVDWDSRNTNIDPEFWSGYVLGSYQHTLDEDNDPDANEELTSGIVDAITTDTSGGSDGEGSGVLIFLEVHRTREIPNYNPNPTNISSLANSVAHEVGHLFSGQHGELGLMGDADGNVLSSQFTPTTINKIRRLLHP